MQKFEIVGGRKIEGIIKNQGAKNAVLAIGVASLLTNEEVILRNVPSVMDIKNLAHVLRATGARVKEGSDMKINANSVFCSSLTTDAARRIRSSVLLPSALISRFPRTRIPLPGGDSIGTRKLDAYVLGLESLGAKFRMNQKTICVDADKIRGAHIVLNFPSVTATEGIIIAAALAEGKTIIENAAKEPEIVDLADFLNSMGAKIEGAGSAIIKISGVKTLHGTDYTIMPDRIAAGTFMVAAASTGGDLLIEKVFAHHLGAIIRILRKVGVTISQSENAVRIECKSGCIKATNITTAVYPGFPTDMQPIFMSLMAIAKGKSRIRETVYDGRFTHVADLEKMGASIHIEKDTAIVKGVEKLNGASLEARDIRSGAALIIAGLAADGVTEISNAYEVDRGYDKLDRILSEVGAEIRRVR